MSHVEDPKVQLEWPGDDTWTYGVGYIQFHRSPAVIRATKLVDGIALTIPTSVRVQENRDVAGRVMLSRLRATMSQSDVEVGLARDENFYVAPMYNANVGELVVRLTSQAMQHIERVRAGGPADFTFSVNGEICVLLPGDGAAIGRTLPRRVFGSVRLTYEKEVWVQMLNTTGVGENVVVEIPLPSNPAAPWDKVWTPLRQAKNALQMGGETATVNAITLCRQAMEAWRDIEKEDRGPGWPNPSDADRKARTRKQRVDVLRWDVLQISHDVVHNASGSPTRDEAVLVLTNLASLLAVRKP